MYHTSVKVLILDYPTFSTVKQTHRTVQVPLFNFIFTLTNPPRFEVPKLRVKEPEQKRRLAKTKILNYVYVKTSVTHVKVTTTLLHAIRQIKFI